MSDEAPRRAPEPHDRVRDAERTRAKLLDAALEEFAARGFAGARVGEIARRAGVNKQLISYYFGGKAGLYEALQAAHLAAEAEHNVAEAPAERVLEFYLSSMLDDDRVARLALWRGLEDETPDIEGGDDIAREQDTFRARQHSGEIDPELDTAALQLALMGMTMAPVALPDAVRKLFGVEPDSPEFRSRYKALLGELLARLKPVGDNERTEQ